MANYQYTGCVTGVTEGGVTQLIQPTKTPMPVARPTNAYTERLVGVGLLSVTDAGSSVNYINLSLPLPNGQLSGGLS